MRRALGKGLSQLIADQFEGNPTELDPTAIVPNPNQPRTVFDEAALDELAESIRQNGLLQPIVVRPAAGGVFEIIAGERRWRASQRAGLSLVPVVVRTVGDQASLELALIENLQREDINAVECARAYRRLSQEFGLTQEQIAEKVGRSRTAVANVLRLLKLPALILEGLEAGSITEGHGRALLGLAHAAEQLAVYERILVEGLSVRETEAIVARRVAAPKPAPDRKPKALSPDDHAIVEGLRMHFGTPVELKRGRQGGSVTLRFHSDDELQRILDAAGFSLEP